LLKCCEGESSCRTATEVPGTTDVRSTRYRSEAPGNIGGITTVTVCTEKPAPRLFVAAGFVVIALSFQ
jgi:hypothetical protein